MAKIVYKFGMDAAGIDAAIAALPQRIGGLVQDIQKVAASIAIAWHTSGDKDTAVKRINLLIAALGKGMRANSMRAYFEQQTPVMYNKETKLLTFGFSAASPVKSHKEIKPEECVANVWYDAAPQEAYKPLEDWGLLIKGIVAKAERDIKELGEKSKVNAEQLAALKAML